MSKNSIQVQGTTGQWVEENVLYRVNSTMDLLLDPERDVEEGARVREDLDEWHTRRREEREERGEDDDEGEDTCIYEWYIVEEQAAKELGERGEFVTTLGYDKGVRVWGRGTTGQAVKLDGCVEYIACPVLRLARLANMCGEGRRFSSVEELCLQVNARAVADLIVPAEGGGLEFGAYLSDDEREDANACKPLSAFARFRARCVVDHVEEIVEEIRLECVRCGDAVDEEEAEEGSRVCGYCLHMVDKD